ncbi:MAG: ribonuclease III [Dehalococcoidia bacterium]|nr:ribonuclease III [Dehalococcoidia bacterium]MDW8120033.1 ribonuclease III [Chloroflexota bacterium]
MVEEAFIHRLGVPWNDPALLRQALVHASYANEHPEARPSNERLEFLGDAFLDFVVAEELFRRCPHLPEGDLTALRSAVVEGKALAQVASLLGISEVLLLGKGEEASGGRERPSTLAGAFEALVGAVLLDQGYPRAREFVLRALGPLLERVVAQGAPKDPKSLLQERLQAEGKGLPEYRSGEVHEGGQERLFVAEVLVHGEVVGRGWGTRKSLAEQEAARQALARLYPEKG